MGLKRAVQKLEEAVQGNKKSFELADGTRYYYDPVEIFSTTFQYFMNVLRADHARLPRPEAPEIVQAMARAKNRRRVFRQVMQGFSFMAYEVMAYEEEALVERGELIPKRLTTEGPVES